MKSIMHHSHLPGAGKLFWLWTAAVLVLSVSNAWAVLPVTGVYVPELAVFDQLMQDALQNYGLNGGVLAISRNGCVVYQRGFGYARSGVVMPENTPMRLASVEKPLTASVIRDLAAHGYISLDDFVFDLGQGSPNGERKLLPSTTYYPYDGQIDDWRLTQIRVIDLLQHRGGWDIDKLDEQNDIVGDGPDFFDPQYECIKIANKMGISSPPGRTNTIRYMMSQPLQFFPGTPPCDRDPNDNCLSTPPGCYCGTNYSNFGYMLLGKIIEEVAGTNVASQLRNRILTSSIWVPSTEIFTGKTFLADQNPREPTYIDTSLVQNCFDPLGPPVLQPYGGWDQWALQGHGNLVASAAPLLKFLDRYKVYGNDIGVPLASPVAGVLTHSGAMAGTNTFASQRHDGVNVVVLLNTRNDTALDALYDAIHGVLNDTQNPITWPTTCVDGFWADFNSVTSGFGGYNDPVNSMNAVQTSTTDGTTLHIKGGSTPWSGILNKKMLIDARGGNAIIGQ